ncbi:MAG: hypothetical protein EA406_00220 [Rhodospirillales bacterium]|nr:MAG: hypothetical protein EA406_00220 [Rhodospirillales bacterium]
MAGAFDFRGQQERSRRATALLVLLFIVLTAAIGLIVGTVVAYLMAATEDGYTPVEATAVPDVQVLATAAALTVAVIVGTALVRIAMLGGDGARVARALGAQEVDLDTANPLTRRYHNIVAEMAIAAGMPAPRVFVIRQEQGINAFAAGSDPERAAVAVTHGALAKLNRQELAGVIAHELSHIANRDSRLNVRLMGMVFGLVALYALGRGMMRAFIFIPRRRDGRTVLPALAVGLTLIVVGLLGVLAGRLLQSAVSRRRESLADATAVQFTRNPEGLANALKKIGASAAGSRVGNAHAEEARHLFFAEATGTLAGLFATHPPLIERIRALDPRFDPATDPVWNSDDKALIHDARRDRDTGPWGSTPPS